jgi:hypothetical protein
VGVLERGQGITAGLKRQVRKLTRFSTSSPGRSPACIPVPADRRPARPSDETSDVRWACADELAANITAEIFGARQPFASTTASTVLQPRDILRTRTFGPNSWALRVTDPAGMPTMHRAGDRRGQGYS